MADSLTTPGESLRFRPDDLDDFAQRLIEMVDAVEDEYAGFYKNIQTWWEWYEAKPLTPVREEPWHGASNVVVPLIRSHSDAIISRFTNTIFATNDVVMEKDRNAQRHPTAHSVAEWLNVAGDNNEFDFFMPIFDGISETVPLGSSILSLRWQNRHRVMFVPGEGGKTEPRSVLMSRGPSIKLIPREQVIFQMDRPIEESEFVSVQQLMNWSEVVAMGQIPDDEGGWNPASVAAIKGNQDGELSTQRAAQTRRSKRSRAGVQQQTTENFRPFDMREIWVNAPIARAMGLELPGQQDPSTPSIPIVVTIHHGTKTVMRIVGHPYWTGTWPFYELHYRRQASRIESAGVCKLLHSFQSSATTTINQAHDSITRANSFMGVTTDKRLAQNNLSMNRLAFVDDINSVKEVNFNKLIQPDVGMFQIMLGMAERLTSVNDANFGQQPRIAGKSGSATSTIALLQESREMFRTSLKLINHPLGRLFEDIATLYQQFEVEDARLVKSIGAGDAANVRTFTFPEDPVPSVMGFELRSISETLNPELERNKALFVQQVTSSYWSQVMQALNVAGQANRQAQQGDPAAAAIGRAALQSIEALTASFTRILESSSIDDLEQFTFQLREANNDPRLLADVQQRVASELGQVATPEAGTQLGAFPTDSFGLPVGAVGAGTPSGL